MTDDADDRGAGAADRGDPEPATYSTQRYLGAKATIDDRALDEGVLDHLRAAVPDCPSVLEVGAGIGTMVARVLDRDLLSGAVEYTAVDLDDESVATARARLPGWARAAGYEVLRSDADGPAAPDLVFERTAAATGGPERLSLTVATADAAAVARSAGTGDPGRVEPADGPPFQTPAAGYDLLVGAAFLDLVDWSTAETLLGGVRPGGLCYLPITFDGTTTFAPAPDPDFEARLERAFHAHLDAGGGTSRAGRRALDRLPDSGVEIVAAGGSDWSVQPVGDGTEVPTAAAEPQPDRQPVPGTDDYPADEAYFLHHVLDLVHGALSPDGGRADAGKGDSESEPGDATDLDPGRVDEWARRRHEQVAAGQLRYLTHQLDLLGRREG